MMIINPWKRRKKTWHWASVFSSNSECIVCIRTLFLLDGAATLYCATKVSVSFKMNGGPDTGGCCGMVNRNKRQRTSLTWKCHFREIFWTTQTALTCVHIKKDTATVKINTKERLLKRSKIIPVYRLKVCHLKPAALFFFLSSNSEEILFIFSWNVSHFHLWKLVTSRATRCIEFVIAFVVGMRHFWFAHSFRSIDSDYIGCPSESKSNFISLSSSRGKYQLRWRGIFVSFVYRTLLPLDENHRLLVNCWWIPFRRMICTTFQTVIDTTVEGIDIQVTPQPSRSVMRISPCRQPSILGRDLL